MLQLFKNLQMYLRMNRYDSRLVIRLQPLSNIEAISNILDNHLKQMLFTETADAKKTPSYSSDLPLLVL